MNENNLQNYSGPSPKGLGNQTGDNIEQRPGWQCSSCHSQFPGSVIPTIVQIKGEKKLYCGPCGTIAAVTKGDL